MATRVQIVLPDDTLAELDQVAGKRHRSEFIAEAVRDKLLRVRHIHAVRQSSATSGGDEIPVWTSAEDVSAFLRASRQRDAERLMQEIVHHTDA